MEVESPDLELNLLRRAVSISMTRLSLTSSVLGSSQGCLRAATAEILRSGWRTISWRIKSVPPWLTVRK